MDTATATKKAKQSLFGPSDDAPDRIVAGQSTTTHVSAVKGHSPHEFGTAYGIDYALWYCRDEGWGGREDFTLFFASIGGETIPGRVRRSRRRGYREVPLHHIDRRNHEDEREELDRRLFMLYWKNVRSEPESPVANARKQIRNVRKKQERKERRERERESCRMHMREKAQRMFGRPPELLRPHHIDAVQNMGNRMAKKSPAHR
jgi:hypothetical protein